MKTKVKKMKTKVKKMKTKENKIRIVVNINNNVIRDDDDVRIKRVDELTCKQKSINVIGIISSICIVVSILELNLIERVPFLFFVSSGLLGTFIISRLNHWNTEKEKPLHYFVIHYLIRITISVFLGYLSYIFIMDKYSEFAIPSGIIASFLYGYSEKKYC